MNEEATPLLQTAIMLLKRGQPVPLDIIYRLAEEGYDYSSIEAAHSL